MWYYAETDEWAPLNERQYSILKAQAHAYARLRIVMRDIHNDFMKDIEVAKTAFPAINPLAHEQTK